MYSTTEIVIVCIAVILIILAIVFLSYVEEKDMREINKAFMNLNLYDPIEVLEYFTLCSTKPTWRMSLIIALAFALFSTGLYLANMPAWVFFFMIIPVSWIATSAYMSYFNFHVWTPAGGQESWNKLKHASMRNVPMKYSDNK